MAGLPSSKYVAAGRMASAVADTVGRLTEQLESHSAEWVISNAGSTLAEIEASPAAA